MFDFIATQTGVATTTSLKSLIQLIAPSNRLIEILEVGIFFAGTSSSAVPITVDLHRQSDAGTSDAMVANTDLQKLNDDLAASLTITGRKNITVEPTSLYTGSIWTAYVHPQQGLVWRPPCPVLIKPGGRLALRVTAAASVSSNSYIIGRE